MYSKKIKLAREFARHCRTMSEENYPPKNLKKEEVVNALSWLEEAANLHNINLGEVVNYYELCNCNFCKELQHQDACRAAANRR